MQTLCYVTLRWIEHLKFASLSILKKASNKETPRWNEAKNWEEVCILSPIHDRIKQRCLACCGALFRLKDPYLKPARKIDKSFILSVFFTEWFMCPNYSSAFSDPDSS
jgi:hypothetical protein